MSAAHLPADTGVPLQEITVGAALADVATRFPDRAAVLWPVDEVLADLTYGELFANASGLAGRLLRIVGPGEPIAVWAPNSVDWLLLEYAAALVGSVLVPLNPALSQQEVRHILTATRVTVVFSVIGFRGSALLDRAQALVQELPLLVHAVDLARWHELPMSSAPLPVVRPGDPLLIQFTSGTTGRPKGAILTHRAAFNSAALSVRRLQPGEHEIWCSAMPLHHVGGSVSVVLATLSVAGTLVLMPSFDAAEALRLVDRAQATVLGAVPTMVLDMLAARERTGCDLGSLRVLQIGGATVAPDLIGRIERELGVRVSNAYGQSEAPNAAQTLLDDDEVDKAQSIGRVNGHREVCVVDPTTGRTVEFDEVGELWLRSPLTMTGYLEEGDRTKQALDGDGWLHTGDLVRMDGRGVLTLIGRLRDVIIRGGENIYPAEVEAAMADHPDLLDVVVVGAPDDRWGEQPVAFVRAVAGRVPTDEDLDAHARSRLAGFKVPRRWVLVDEFPMTASGKVKRFDLQLRLPNPPAITP